MIKLLGRLLGRDPTGGSELATTSRSGGDVVKRYFELAAEIQQAKAKRDYPRAITAARATYPLFPAFVRRWKREYGAFDISTSHAVHTASTLMAVMEEADGLRELRMTLESIPELRPWLATADEAQAFLAAVPHVLKAVRDNPGLSQSSLRKEVPAAHAGQIGRYAVWLEKGGRLRRVKKGSAYQLYPPENDTRPCASTPSTRPTVGD